MSSEICIKMYLFLKVQLLITSLKTQLVFCLCGVEAEPRACLRPLGARSSPVGRGSELLSLQPVPEAWHLLPSPPSVSAQHGNEVAETVVNSSLEFMESCFSRVCRLLTDHQGRMVGSGSASSLMVRHFPGGPVARAPRWRWGPRAVPGPEQQPTCRNWRSACCSRSGAARTFISYN